VDVLGGEVSKSSLIKDILAVTPDRSPKEIAEELTAQGIPTTANYVSTIKTGLKNVAPSPRGKGRAKKSAKKAAAKATRGTKAAAKAPRGAKPAPKAASVNITFDQLRMAKEMARQLGGTEKAKEVLNALVLLSE
jgi:hypothetical protein